MSRRNHTTSNQTTGVDTRIDLLATEATQNQVLQAIKGINISAEIGEITVESSDTITHTKLDTLNTTVNTLNTTVANKHLDYQTDSVTVTGNVNVEKVVEPVLYNLQVVGDDMYADSINGAIVDIYGRKGWFWTNSATTGGSNAYWYSNTIVPQNQMTKAQIECVYVILALDRVQPEIVLPIFPMYSLPTGSGDISPGFAHSAWTYVIPATNILNAGEVVMFTIGDHTKVDKIRPELRRVHLELFGTNGDALPTEVIGLISLNTDSGTKLVNSIQYLLQNAGFYYSVTNKVVEYEFNNGVQNAININLTEGGININGTVTVSGNVNVDNFPTSFEVSSLPSVEINNFPTSTEISNFPTSFEVSNFPTSTEISNFPTSFEVSNTVSVYDSNTEAINQKLINAAAPNNDCIKVFQANNPTSIQVSNFPASQAVTGTFFQTTQPVSGTVAVSNTGFNVNNFPASQTVNGTVTVNTISGFALESGGNLASIKSNTDRIKSDTTNADAIQVQVKNSSIPVTGTFFQTTQPVSGTVAVSNTGFNVNNFPASQTVNGTVNVNTISGFAVESGGNLASIKTNTDRIKSDTTNTDAIQVQVKNSSIPVTGTFYQTTQPVSGTVAVSNTGFDVNNFPASQTVNGTVNVNTISGFAVESGGNLASIKTNTDKIKSDTTNADAIQVQVKNSSIAVTGTFYQTTQPVSGTVAVSNTGFDVNNFPASTNSHTQAYDPSGGGGYFDITSTSISATVSALDVAVKNTVAVTGTFYQETQPVSGDVSITNTSLDTHCYASSDGTNWHHLKSTNAGNLITESKTHDGSNVPITSTLNGAKQSLDVNVANTVAVNTISGFALETGGNLASIKTNTDKIKSDTTNTDAIQVQVKNSSIPVTGTITANIAANQRVLANVCDKQDNGITSTNHTINKYGLDTTSALATTDMTTRYLLTSTSDGGSKRGLDVNIASGSVAITAPSAIAVTGTFYQEIQPVSIDTSSSIPVTGDITIDNGSTTNFDSATGINVYQILPKVKMYSLGGFDGNSTANSLIIGAATTAQVTSSAAFNFGGTMQFWAVLGSGGSRNITFDYVDSSGIIQTTTVENINSSTTTSLGTFKSILDFRLSSGIVSGETLYIGTSSVVNTLKERSVYYEDINQKLIGAINIPNGYIGYITNLTSQVASASNITLNRWNSSGVKSAVWRVNNQGNANINSGYEGTLGGIFNAGDTLAFSAQSAVASKSVIANLVLKSIL